MMLIVEDERSFITRFKLAFKAIRESVQGLHDCANDIQALAMFSKLSPEIVFLDINIKGSKSDGFEILEQLKGMNNASIGIISSSESKADIQKAKQVGANFYIVKSGNRTLFIERMSRFKTIFIDGEHDGGFRLFN